ncbi:MAG: type VI secretion system protein ImpG [Glomeribacter sp. 1016415]|nr:type VI secretion system protein ImpG [Glomeribacter sp. 1016415]
MNPTLLKYYSQELQYLREIGGEFAEAFPKIAGRLGLDSLECADPNVERLLEGFSFLAARVQMKLDAQFPQFTQQLMELIYPHYLAPTPAMTVVQLQPDLSHPGLADGVKVPRQSALHSVLDKHSSTRCEYRTGQDVTLWPLELTQAQFFTHSEMLSNQIVLPHKIKAGIRLRLKLHGGLKFNQLKIERLPLYLQGADGLATRIYEYFIGAAQTCIMLPVERPAKWRQTLPKNAVRPMGFDETEALLPLHKQSFQGYRLLQEYFAFPARFLFVEIAGLQPALSHCAESEIEIYVLLDRTDALLERRLDVSNFALHCTPAINLFARRTDRIPVNLTQAEYHVVVDRTRPLDFEVYQIEEVIGHGVGTVPEQKFRPLYAAHDHRADRQPTAFYQVRREKRRLPTRQQPQASSDYLGNETFISLVDSAQAPFDDEVRQLGLKVLCTNRHLATDILLGAGTTDFTLDGEAPLKGIRCLAGPSAPLPAYAEETAWRLINHLSLNYSSLVDAKAGDGVQALHDLLNLYCPAHDIALHRQIEGLRSLQARPVTRRLPSHGPIIFGRGFELTLLFDEAEFEGASAFLFSAILAQFFAQYVSVNSFTETVLKTIARGEVFRWPARIGRCQTL